MTSQSTAIRQKLNGMIATFKSDLALYQALKKRGDLPPEAVEHMGDLYTSMLRIIADVDRIDGYEADCLMALLIECVTR